MRPTGGRIEQVDTGKPRNKCRDWKLVAAFGEVDGRYPRKARRFSGTVRQANAALAEWLAELELEDERRQAPTFADYAAEWHAARARSGRLARRTVSGEEPKLKAACMHLGNMDLGAIAPADIERCYTALSHGKTPSGRPYSPKTLDNVHRVLSAMFNDAVRDGIIDSAPTKRARRPRVPQSERNVPSAEQVDAMLAAMDFDDPHCMAVMLCARFGLRRSEAVGVEWSDWDGRRLTVARASEDDGTPKPTKNVCVREVPAPPDAAAILDARKGDGRICPLTPNALYQWWDKRRDGFGMQGVQLHGLRHAYATRLAAAGVHPRVMMELGGWKSIDVCMKIYTHVNSGALDEAVSAAFGA